MILGFLALLITFLLVIGLHEAGHALAAKLLGVKIQRVSIGFGKPLLKWQNKQGIEWVWALWPLGGYVQLLNSRIQPVSETEFPYCFDKKPIWVRCSILLAGALANLLVAWFALTLMFMLGYKQNPAIVQTVVPQSLVATAGIKAGDRLIAVDSYETASWQDVGMRLIAVLGQAQVPITVSSAQHGVRMLHLDLSSWHFPRQKGSLLTLLGIQTGSLKAQQQWVAGESFFTASRLAINKIGELLFFFMLMLKQLVTGVIPLTLLLGPIGFFSVSLNSFAQGFSVFMYFIASLSLTVGFVNLFPVPGLDGGSIVYALIEKVRGAPVSVAMEVLLHQLAIILFGIFFVQLILNDLQRYFT